MNCRRLLSVCVVALVCVTCGDPPVTEMECPDYRPTGYEASCASDQACESYLICRRDRCVLPPTMNGVGESTSREVTISRQNASSSIVTLEAETASSEYERMLGLSGRPCMMEGWGMLFVHPEQEELTYATDRATIPLDLVFMDSEKRVVSIFRDVPPTREAIPSGAPARYVLETRAGALADVQLGDVAAWDAVE